jgi:two-component system, sensor histidine kinase YesM
MSMRRQITLFFIFLVAIPIVTIYSVAIQIFFQSTKNDLQALFSTNIHGVGKNIDRFFADALDLTIYPLMETNLKAFLTASSEDTNFFKISSNANNILLSMPYGFSGGIRGAALRSKDGVQINVGLSFRITDHEAEAARALNSRPYWDYGGGTSPIFVTRLLKDPSNLPQQIGFIKIAMSRSQLDKLITSDHVNHSMAYFIVDEQNRSIVATGDTGELGRLGQETSYEHLLELAASPSPTEINGQFFTSAYKIDRTPFILYSVVKPNILTMIKGTLVKGLSLTAVLVFLFALILSVTFSRIITSPLIKLGKRMKAITNEDFSVRIEVDRNDEIAVLAHNFNNMAERLDFLYKEVYMGHLKLQQARLRALQSQINPHFLYNTLDTIYWMSEMGDTRNVSLMVSNMSKMMRLTLSPDNRDMVQLAEELEHLTSYIHIQRIRYGERFVFDIDCPEELLGCYVLRLLLQPLVENALIHGLKDRTSGLVKVRIVQDEDKLIYEVMNDGTPVDVEGIRQLLEEKGGGLRGFALRNIQERLALKYGDGFQLDCDLHDGLSVFRITQRLQVNDESTTDPSLPDSEAPHSDPRHERSGEA